MSNSRSVLIVAPSAYPIGGLQTWLDYLVAGLQSQGLRTRVGLVGGRWHSPEAYLAEHPALPAVRVHNPTGSREGRVRALIGCISKIDPDLVVGVNIPDAYTAVARIRSMKGASPKAVMTIHGLEPDLFEDARAFRGTLDGVVCTNRLACQLAIEDGGVDKARVYYAPYGVELPEKPRREPGDGILRVAFAGRLEESQKRVDDLARITEVLADAGTPFRLTVAGEGPDGPSLRGRLKPLVDRGLVRFLGAVTQREVQDSLLPATDVLLLTSSWETGPIVVWEAMAAGVAVVSSRYVGSGLEGALADGKNCLLFDVGDAAKAADRILELRDGTLHGLITAAGMILVRERYTVSHSVSTWAGVFDAISRAAPLEPKGSEPRLAAAGRLDRWFGAGPAEMLRRIAGRSFPHGEPGGEWPHSYGLRPRNDAEFCLHATALDRGETARESMLIDGQKRGSR